MKKTLLSIALSLLFIIGWSQEDCHKFKAFFNTIKTYEKKQLVSVTRRDVVTFFNYDCNNTLYIKDGSTFTYFTQDTKYVQSTTNAGEPYIAARFLDNEYHIKHLIQIFEKEDAIRVFVGDDIEFIYCNDSEIKL